MSRIHHYFIPHEFNNFRARLLHHSSLFILIVALFFLSVSALVIKDKPSQVLGVSYSISSQELVTLTNKVRIENNLNPLKINQKLTLAARNKAADMFAKNYWAHFAPDGTSPWYFIKSAGYQYDHAGENLAKGFTDSDDIVAAWMDSKTHRDNLLSSHYKDIGFAVVEGKLLGEDTVLVVQMFGSTPTEFVEGSDTEQQENVIVGQVPQSQNVLAERKIGEVQKTPLVDIRLTSKAIIFIVMITLVSVLLLDLYIVEKKKIPRLVGHNVDHIILISLFIVFMIIAKNGGIL